VILSPQKCASVECRIGCRPHHLTAIVDRKRSALTFPVDRAKIYDLAVLPQDSSHLGKPAYRIDDAVF
jgi:hypothetical protein